MKRGLLLGLTGLFILLIIGIISAEKIGIDINNNYVPGDNIRFKITLYDDYNKIINKDVGFIIKNYYKEVITSGNAKSGEDINFKLPENSERGLWEISAKHNDIEQVIRFNVLELERAEIKIEGSNLIITNVGNVPYGKSMQITIQENKETILVPLGFGETKTIRLTAPAGNYEVRVNDGTQKEDIVFSGVSLTGNVIGVENPRGNNILNQYNIFFFNEYPMVSMFLVVLVLVILIIIGLKIYHGYF